MDYDYGIPTLLLQFLGACLFSDAKGYYTGLSETARSKLEMQGQSFGVTAWFYRYLCDILPPRQKTQYQKNYLERQVKALMDAQELKRIYHIFSAHNLRFVPIKGADLTYRLYPDIALRMFMDWDIWFHPDDCKRALDVLKEDGWRVPKSYSANHETVMKFASHHFSPHLRGQYAIEPHFRLANFKGVDLQEMWKKTIQYPDGEGQRVLSPEMNVLMLTRHAASDSYYHAHLPKLLTDVAMVMQKEEVDFPKLRSIAACWHLPYPGDMLAAFPEFFPPSKIEQFNANPQKATEFRRLFELRGKMDNKPNRVALLLDRYGASRQMRNGVLNYILSLKPDKIRHIYLLPQNGAWGSVAWAYICYLSTRIWWVLSTLIQRDHLLYQYSEIVESIESEDKSPNKTGRI